MWLMDGQTDGRTDERHTIIGPKFYFGRIKITHTIVHERNYQVCDYDYYHFFGDFLAQLFSFVSFSKVSVSVADSRLSAVFSTECVSSFFCLFDFRDSLCRLRVGSSVATPIFSICKKNIDKLYNRAL